jgi:hypothetical protein
MNVNARTREAPGWLKIAMGTSALLGGMVLVMWAQQGPAVCAVSRTPWMLHLDRTVDRERLAADTAAATRAARRYMAAGTSVDDRLHRFVECDARLVGGIAAEHGLSVEQVRANAASAE